MVKSRTLPEPWSLAVEHAANRLGRPAHAVPRNVRRVKPFIRPDMAAPRPPPYRFHVRGSVISLTMLRRRASSALQLVNRGARLVKLRLKPSSHFPRSSATASPLNPPRRARDLATFLAGRPPSAAPKQMTVPEGPPTTSIVASELILEFDGADTTILHLAKLDPPSKFPAGKQG